MVALKDGHGLTGQEIFLIVFSVYAITWTVQVTRGWWVTTCLRIPWSHKILVDWIKAYNRYRNTACKVHAKQFMSKIAHRRQSSLTWIKKIDLKNAWRLCNCDPLIPWGRQTSCWMSTCDGYPDAMRFGLVSFWLYSKVPPLVKFIVSNKVVRILIFLLS